METLRRAFLKVTGILILLTVVRSDFIWVDEPGPLVAGIGTNLTIKFEILDKGIRNQIHTHTDLDFYSFPPEFDLDLDSAMGQVVLVSTRHNNSASVEYKLIGVDERLFGRYGVGVGGIELHNKPVYVEVVMPLAKWKETNRVVTKTGERLNVTCMAVQYASLRASTNLSARYALSSSRQKRMLSHDGPNPVASLSITTESVTKSDAGRYACTSQDIDDPEIVRSDYLDVVVEGGPQCDVYENCTSKGTHLTGTLSLMTTFILLLCGRKREHIFTGSADSVL